MALLHFSAWCARRHLAFVSAQTATMSIGSLRAMRIGFTAKQSYRIFRDCDIAVC
jgi:hypothetical protein